MRVVNGLFYLIYFTITVPVCLVVLIFWLVRLITTVFLMVFVLLLQAWGRGGQSDRPRQIMREVLAVGPDAVDTLMSFRLNSAPVGKPADQGRDLLFELAYSVLFVAAIAGIFIFRGYLQSFGSALETPISFFLDNGLAAKLGIAYVLGSCIFAGYVLATRDRLEDGPFLNFFIPIYLLLSGIILVFMGYLAVSQMR